MLLKFQKAEKQMTAKPNVDYFQRVCDANKMHELFTEEIPLKPEILSEKKVSLMYTLFQ